MFIRGNAAINVYRYASILSWSEKITSCPENERIRFLPDLNLLLDAMVWLDGEIKNQVIDILKEFPLEYIGEEAFLSKRSDPEFVPGLILLRNADAEGYAYIFL